MVQTKSDQKDIKALRKEKKYSLDTEKNLQKEIRKKKMYRGISQTKSLKKKKRAVFDGEQEMVDQKVLELQKIKMKM